MHGASKEYCLDMILTYEPTESRKKKRELGIDGNNFIRVKKLHLTSSPLHLRKGQWAHFATLLISETL